MQISAVVIWKNGHYLGTCTTLHTLNCNLFNNDTPKAAWLSNMSYCCGGDEAYKLTFSKPKNDPNALSGTFIVEDGLGYFVDGVVSDVIAKCDACCGDNVAVTPVYNGTFPAILLPLAKTYTVTRADDGTFRANEKFRIDYMDWIIDGSLTSSRSGSNTIYVFTAYYDPIPQGPDTIVETPRVFTSNTAPSLSGSNVFQVTGLVDNVAYNVKGATTLAATVTILNADALAKTFGTWSVSGSTLVLTTTSANYATIVLGQEAP